MRKLRKVLLFLAFYFMVLPVALASHTTTCFQCSGVNVVLLPTGFWVPSDWFCPHGHFFFPRGFHLFPHGFPINRFLGFHGSWVIPAYPPPQGESWEAFVERYLKEHPPTEKEEPPVIFSDGELVKSNTSATYLYAGASLHHVPDTRTLSAISTKRDLKVVSQKVLASIPVGESVPVLNDGLYIKGSEPQVYSLKSNRKKAVSEKKLKKKKDVKIKEIPDWLLELIPE